MSHNESAISVQGMKKSYKNVPVLTGVDALRILDYYKLKKAHMVWMSLCGMIEQILALRNPVIEGNDIALIGDVLALSLVCFCWISYIFYV